MIAAAASLSETGHDMKSNQQLIGQGAEEVRASLNAMSGATDEQIKRRRH